MLCKRYSGYLGTGLVALTMALALLFSARGTLSKTLSEPTGINPQAGTLILNELSPWGGTDKVWFELIKACFAQGLDSPLALRRRSCFTGRCARLPGRGSCAGAIRQGKDTATSEGPDGAPANAA
jgi:hypothetical protein